MDSTGPSALLDDALRKRFEDYDLEECLVLAGGDHGYWREERLCKRLGSWCGSIDSHRGASSRTAGKTNVMCAADLSSIEPKTRSDDIHWHAIPSAVEPKIEDLRSSLRGWLQLQPDEHGLIRPDPDVRFGVLVWREGNGRTTVFAIARHLAERFWSIWQQAEAAHREPTS